MTTNEFSVEFDILYNNITSNQAPGLDEYEKSVLLTQAQEAVIKDLYSGSYTLDSFESTELSTRLLNELVKHISITPITPQPTDKLSNNSTVFALPTVSINDTHTKVWFIIFEEVKDSNNKYYLVQPTTHDKYYNDCQNPFRNNNKYRVLRISKENKVEIIHNSDITLSNYILRYIEKPSPIILTNLEDGLSINGVSTITECKLNPLIHRQILMKAVELAKILYNPNKSEQQ